MVISIVIPAFNEEEWICLCLESLISQRIKQSFEVVVVDNGSTDRTNEIAGSYQDRLNLKVVQEKNKGRGWARHTGFSKAKGEIILSTDADTQLPPDWLEKMVRPFISGKVAAVTGPCLINDCSRWENVLFNKFYLLGAIFFRIFFGHFWLSGYNFAIRKEIYLKSGGFNPKLNAQEDVDLGFRVKNLGQIKYINLPVIFSGRRFKGHFWQGLLSYPKIFIEYYFLKKEAVYLDDVR